MKKQFVKPMLLAMFLLTFSINCWGETLENSSSAGIQSEKKQTSSGSQYITMDFDDVDIKVFIKFIADVTGKNFVIGDDIKGKVTVISPKKMSIDEAYRVFESVLEVNGFTTVAAGGVMKIVKMADAQTKNLETRLTTPTQSEDRMVTQIIPLIYADANDMKTLLAPFVSKKSGDILAYPQTNMLIVTDTLSNIKRLMKILESIDVPGSIGEVQIFSLSYASATSISAKLTEILTEKTKKTTGSTAGTTTDGIKVIPDERTNSLIIFAPTQEFARIGELIKKLDMPTPEGKQNVHVYYLKYASAEDLAKVLTEIPKQGTEVEAKTSAKQDLKITADKDTNSLVIYADPNNYAILLDAIQRLDIPRKQVYVKALIMEVSTTKDFKVGVEWSAFEDFDYGDGKTGGVFGKTGADFITDPSGLPSGPLLGVMGEAIPVITSTGTTYYPNMISFINAMKQDTDVKIISTPQIITLDNKQAEIKVGKNMPYITKEADNTNDDNDVTRVYDYRDVGTTLRITPHISLEGNIRIEMFHEITTLVEGEGEAEFAPTTLKRSATTTLMVKNNNTMVIGGLIGEDLTYTDYRVPILGNIPYLGRLFRSTTRKGDDTNLYIFLTPAIIDTDEAANKLYQEKYGEIKTSLDEQEQKQKEK
jgi:general secretion pathway protein D